MHNSFRNDTTYKIIKLSNGETIIASLINEGKNSIEIQNPLLMTIDKRSAESSNHDSLNLSRWIEPFTDQKYFDITKSTIITTAVVSAGLTSYYEHFLRKMDKWIDDNDEQEFESLEEEECTDEEIYDELLYSIETSNKSIH
tara:strand:- start:1025 stop:1450 length:426 start_codon:yes stop_codon:yes gene_type:complete